MSIKTQLNSFGVDNDYEFAALREKIRKAANDPNAEVVEYVLGGGLIVRSSSQLTAHQREAWFKHKGES